MEQLTIQELSAYLPWDVKVKHGEGIETLEGVGKGTIKTKEFGLFTPIHDTKLILYPLSHFEAYFSELFDEDIDVRTFLNEDFITEENQFSDIQDMITNYKPQWWPYGVVELALKHHFDFQNLIPRGLAIDKTTL